MINCNQCKYSEELVPGIQLVCFHKKHPLSKCSHKDHHCDEYESIDIPEEPARVEW